MTKQVSLVLDEQMALAVADSIILLAVTISGDADRIKEAVDLAVVHSINSGCYSRSTIVRLCERVMQMADVFDPPASEDKP